jgi:hypothetical protein
MTCSSSGRAWSCSHSSRGAQRVPQQLLHANGHMPQRRRCDTSTPGVWPLPDDSMSAWPPTSHRHVKRCYDGNLPAAASGSGSSHEPVPPVQRAHAIRTGPASPHGRTHLVGENRRPFGPHRPRSPRGAGSLRGTRRPGLQTQPYRARPSSGARNAGPHDKAGPAVCAGTAAPGFRAGARALRPLGRARAVSPRLRPRRHGECERPRLQARPSQLL